MGSLMAGWQTNRSDAKQVLHRSTSSLTKKEVERFWRTKRSSIARHLRYIEALAPTDELERSGLDIDGSDSSSETESAPSTPTGSTPGSVGTPHPGWWTKSKWAFLNEPPTQEVKKNHYTPQFDLYGTGKINRVVQRRNSTSVL